MKFWSLLWMFLYISLFSGVTRVIAQDSDQVRFGGYLKNMHTILLPGEDVVLLENLIHHRLNFRWYIDDNFILAAEMRNRAFMGNITAATPNFGQNVQEASDDWIPLSVLWFDRPQFAMHSTLDRLYIDWNKNSWNIRLGRQRINWGINLAFNPNDLFNAYNFLDFDYEERPGSDAIRVQYFSGMSSGWDLAVKGASTSQDMVAALRWFTNVRNYDIQLLGGYSAGDIALGGGWAGQIKNIGWKGEATGFFPVLTDTIQRAFSATTGFDYMFGKGWYLFGGYLYNSDAGLSPESLFLQTDRALSARRLFPFEHSIISMLSYPVSPVVNTSLSVIYAPGSTQFLVLNPTLALSMAENWDLDLVWQWFIIHGELTSDLISTHLAFLRIRFSF